VTVEQPDAALGHLRAEIEEAGGPLSEALLPASAQSGSALFGPVVAQGPRTAGSEDAYALVVESIFEGYLLHYASGRIMGSPDPDLRLLAGDYLYAFGLARLAVLGDLEAIDELAELISLCARAHASSSADDEPEPWELTGGLWALGALAIGAGRWPDAAEAKRSARQKGASASKQVLDVANVRAEELGLERHLGPALIGFERLGKRRNGRRKDRSPLAG
jgi:hypothetical protein